MKSTTALLLCVSLTVVEPTFSASPMDSDRVQGSANQVIDGAAEPEKIPFFMKYAVFIKGYEAIFATELSSKLASRDHAILSRLAVDNESWEASEYARYKAEFIELCSTRTGKDAQTLARDSERIAAESNKRREVRYRHAIDSLSANGREVVGHYVESVITPRMKTSTSDAVEEARADPEQFVYGIDMACYRAIHGAYPPEVEEEMGRLIGERLEKLREEVHKVD